MGTAGTTTFGEGPGYFLAKDEAPVAVVAFGVEGLAQEQGGDDDRDEEKDAGHQVGQQEGILVEEPAVAEEAGILFGGLGEKAAKGRAKDGAYAPDEGHQGEGSGLEFFLGHHFGDNGSQDAD